MGTVGAGTTTYLAAVEASGGVGCNKLDRPVGSHLMADDKRKKLAVGEPAPEFELP